MASKPLHHLHCLCLSQGVAIPAILAAYVRKEVFVYTLAQLVELFHAFPAILGTACYFLHIFWVVNGMYIIYFFPDDRGERRCIMVVSVQEVSMERKNGGSKEVRLSTGADPHRYMEYGICDADYIT